MTSREIIRRLLAHNEPPRLGIDFLDPYGSDVRNVWPIRLVLDPALAPLRVWGRHETLLARVPGFRGEVCLDSYGNILGRLEGRTKGECVLGTLQSGWEALDGYRLPAIDCDFVRAQGVLFAGDEKYVIAGSPYSVFSSLRDARLMPNALMDVLLEPEAVEAYLDRIVARCLELADLLAGLGCDAMIMADDWGTQDRTFISPDAFRALFCPAYRRICDRLHEHGMAFILHSCGNNIAFIDDMLAAGVDALQFDQLGLYGYARMAERYAAKTVFYSPVDIQMTLPTGDRALIEREALAMASAFRRAGGGLLMKDYPAYGDIGVDLEWAKWARDVLLAHTEL